MTNEYSTEKAKLIKAEMASLSSKRESLQNSTYEQIKPRKDEYSLYIDRPFNSIDGKLKWGERSFLRFRNGEEGKWTEFDR